MSKWIGTEIWKIRRKSGRNVLHKSNKTWNCVSKLKYMKLKKGKMHTSMHYLDNIMTTSTILKNNSKISLEIIYSWLKIKKSRFPNSKKASKKLLMRFKLYLRNEEKRITILKTLSLRMMLYRKRMNWTKMKKITKVRNNSNATWTIRSRIYKRNCQISKKTLTTCIRIKRIFNQTSNKVYARSSGITKSIMICYLRKLEY